VRKLANPVPRARLLLSILALLAGCGGASNADVERGSSAAGQIVITRQACGSCHVIPGIELANGLVGPPLTQFASRQMIAGALPNSPANLAAFLHSPQSVVKGGAMPDMGLSRREARDAAAYLLTLK
jgi:cytochrome c2